MTKKKFILFCLMVLLGMFFTHPYVIYVAEGWVAEVLKIFDSDGESIKVINNDPPRDRIRLLTCERTNGVAIFSALIDVWSEKVVRGLDGLHGCVVQNRAIDPLSYDALKGRLSVHRLAPEVFSYRVADLLSPCKDTRDLEIRCVIDDIERAFDPIHGTGCHFYTRWGVTISRSFPIYTNPLVDDPPLDSDQHVFWAIVSSHYKAIFFEEVEKYLTKQAMSSGNQYIKEVEAMLTKQVMSSANQYVKVIEAKLTKQAMSSGSQYIKVIEAMLTKQAISSDNPYIQEIEAMQKVWTQETAENKTDH